MSNLTFDDVDLSALGLITPGVQGVHDLAGIVVSQTFVPGYALPNESVLRDELVQMEIACVVEGTNHADLVGKLHTLRTYLSPRLGWKYLTVEGLTGKRTLARWDKFPIGFDVLPYFVTVAEFTLSGWRAPWWEDASEQSATITSSPDTVMNDGDLPCWPMYTCTLSADMPSGLWFEVQGIRFSYEGGLVQNDVLVVETELPDVTLNGSRAISGVADDSEFPGLGAGESEVVLSDDTKFSLGIAFRRRFE